MERIMGNFFPIYLNYTLSQKYLHIFLLLFEYYPITISVVNCSIKILDYDLSINTIINSPANINCLFPFRVINNGLSNNTNLILFICVTSLLILYYPLMIINNKIVNSIFANIYDLFIFRYGSFFVISIYLNIVFNNNGSFLTTFICIIMLILFIVQSLIHISNFYILIHFSNPNLSSRGVNYPFDYFISIRFNKILLIIKFFVSFEYVYFHSKAVTIDIFIVGFNLFIIALFIIQLYSITLFLYFNFSTIYYIINTVVNLFHFSIILSNILILLLTLFFQRVTSSRVIPITIIIISYFWSIYTISAIWIYHVQKNFYDGWLTLDKIIYILTKEKDNFYFDGYSIDYKKMIDSFELKHKIYCRESKEDCKICIYLSNLKKFDDNSNIPDKGALLNLIHIYKAMYKIKEMNNYNRTEVLDSKIANFEFTFSFYHNVLEIIFYHLNHHYYKLFYIYKKIYRKSTTISFLNIKIILKNILDIENTNDKSFSQNNSVFNEIFLFYHFNCKLRKTLKLVKDFVAQPNELKKYSSFFSLSKTLKELHNELIDISIKMEDKQESSGGQDAMNKNLIQFYKYNLNINRFIIETLINKKIDILPPVDLESQDEYLFMHYVNDKFLILGVKMNNCINLKNPEITIIKAGKEFFPYTNTKLESIFHSLFVKHGMELFIIQLGNIDKDNGIFEFIYKRDNNEDSYEYFKYMFRVFPNLISDHVIVYGFYKNEITKFMVFSEESKENLRGNSVSQVLHSLSSNLERSLGLDNEWIKILNYSNYSFNINNLFKIVEVQNEKLIFCNLDFSYYLKSLSKYKKYLFDFYEQYDKTKIEKLTNSFERLKKQVNFKTNLFLKLKFSITLPSGKTFKVYEFSFENIKSKLTTLSKIQKFDSLGGCQSSQDFNGSEQYMLNIQTMVTNSTTSMSSPGKSSTFSRKKNGTLFNIFSSDNGLYSQIKNDKLKHIKKTFSFFSTIILVLNIILIGVSVLFLIIQIRNIEKMTMINTIYFQFKRIRIGFSHSFLTVFSNFCPCNTLECLTCDNGFIDFSDKFQKKYSLPLELSLRNYVIGELNTKSLLLQNLYSGYKKEVFSYNDESLINTINSSMKYSSLIIDETSISYETSDISFDVGIKIFTNALSVLSEAQPSFDTVKVYLLSYTDGSVSFQNVSREHIANMNHIEREIYSIMLNFMNYFSVFSDTENSIIHSFDNVQSKSWIVMISFMVIICGLNFFLCFICLYYIVIVKDMFASFIMKIFEVMNNQNFLVYYNEKITQLIKLSFLYEKNPNKIIKSIKKNDHAQINKFKEVKRNAQTPEVKEQTSQPIDEKSLKGNNDLGKVLNKFHKKIIIIFSLYAAISISFDIVLIIIFKQFSLINDYGYEYVRLENQIYNNIVVTDLSSLLNLTQADLASLLGEELPSDGLINGRVRSANEMLFHLRSIETNNKNLITSSGDYYEYDCDKIFETLNDSIAEAVINLHNVNYYPLFTVLCKHYNILSLKDFNFLYNKINILTHNVNNMIIGKSYGDLVAFNEQESLYDLFTLVLVLFRLIQNHFRLNTIVVIVNKAMNVFVGLMWSYLCYNIITNILMFFFLNKIIIARLNTINDNLNLLDSCLSCSV